VGVLPPTSVNAFSNLFFWVFFFVGLYVYVALVRQLSSRVPVEGDPGETRTFGLPEALISLFLITFLLWSAVKSFSAQSSTLNSSDLVANIVITVVALVLLAGFLEFRRINVEKLAGFSRHGIVRSVSTGALLLLAAYPMISAADLIMRFFSDEGSSKQNIVELFNGSRTMSQRAMIIVLAVAIAPIAEEFVFRFFIYGVMRRYIGRFGGLIFTSLLFAAVHAHLPSFVPLFVLAACFTIAYEWSGSILVSMTMHSLFNSLSLIFLAFPQLSDQ
jgi:membrane protease YdiL (CAAX protease family)